METVACGGAFIWCMRAMRTASLFLCTGAAWVAVAPAAAARADALVAYASARTAGMGGAGVASSCGAATLHYNPALVAYEESLGAELALQAQYDFDSVAPSASFAVQVPLGVTWAAGLALGPG